MYGWGESHLQLFRTRIQLYPLALNSPQQRLLPLEVASLRDMTSVRGTQTR